MIILCLSSHFGHYNPLHDKIEFIFFAIMTLYFVFYGYKNSHHMAGEIRFQSKISHLIVLTRLKSTQRPLGYFTLHDIVWSYFFYCLLLDLIKWGETCNTRWKMFLYISFYIISFNLKWQCRNDNTQIMSYQTLKIQLVQYF